MTHPATAPIAVVIVWTALVSAPARGADAAAPADGDGPVNLRVQTEVFAGDATEPVARSLSLFQEQVAWDFLEPGAEGSAAAVAEEIVLHDPARSRIVVIAPGLRIRTEISRARLERVRSSLQAWARESDDELLRWSADAECAPQPADAATMVELDGPGARYRVVGSPAPSAAAARTYREFADAAVVLRALLHPGGLPPFPRMAINRRLATSDLLPETVTLELDAGSLRQPHVLRSEHRFAPRLVDADLARIESASAAMAVAEVVDPDEYTRRINATAVAPR